MDVNDRNRDTRPSDEGGDEFLRVFESLSNNFSSTSEGLSDNTTGLKVNTKSLDNNTRVLQDIARQFDKITSKFGEDLQDAADKTRRSIEDSGDIAQDLTTDMRETFERGSHNINQSMKLGQKVANFLIDSLKIVGGTIIKQYTDAANTVAAKYKESLSSVTVKMQMSKGDYSDMFNDISRQLQQEGLNKSFSVVDFTDSLEEVLSTGVRGEEAKREAYQNMITNKLLPAISTNTTAYRKMSKTFSDSFNENYLAMEKYTEQLYGAEGIEEGKSGEVLDALESRLRNEVAKGEMTEEEAMRALTIAQSSASALESSGVSADDLVGILNDFANGMSVASAGTSYYTGLSSTDEFSTENLIKAITTYLERGGYSSAAGRVTNQALGSVLNDRTSQDLETAVLNGLNIDDILDKAQETIDSTQSTYNKWMEGLKNGDFSTSDQILDKVTENAATSLGVAEAQIARFDEISSDVKTIVGLLGDIIFNQVTGGFGSGEKSLLSQIGKKITSTKVGSAVSSFGGASSIGGGLLNLAAGPSALIVGGALAAKDTIEGAVTANQNGASAPEVALQAYRGFLTGGKKDSEEEKSTKLNNALSGKGVDFDWGAVGGNALKWGALGAGVGTAAGGWAAGLGTAIGGAVGTVGGALANAIDQMVENAKYNALAESVDKFNESLSKADSAISNYQAATEKSEKVQNALAVATGKVSASEGSREKSFKELQSMYPELLSNTTSYSDLTARQVELLEAQIENEEKLARDEATKAASDLFGDGEGSVGKLLSSVEALLPDKSKSTMTSSSKNLIDAMKESETEVSKIQGGTLHGMSQEQVDAQVSEQRKEFNSQLPQMISEGAQSMNMSEEDYLKYFNDALGGKDVITRDTSGNYVLNTETNDIGESGYSMGMSYYKENFDENGYSKDFNYTDVAEEMNLASQALTQGIQELTTLAMKNLDEDGKLKEGVPTYTIDSWKGILENLKENALYYNELDLRAYGGVNPIHSDSPSLEEVNKLASAIGEPLQFKVGAYNIPRDDVPAILHRGEMVLTSANADTLRDLAGGDVSGYLARQSIADSIEKYLAAVPTDGESSESSTTVASAIETQTESITGVLNNILVLLQSRLGDRHVVSPTTLSDNYLEFLGANS